MSLYFMHNLITFVISDGSHCSLSQEVLHLITRLKRPLHVGRGVGVRIKVIPDLTLAPRKLGFLAYSTQKTPRQ